MVQAVIQAIGSNGESQMKLCWLAHGSPPAGAAQGLGTPGLRKPFLKPN